MRISASIGRTFRKLFAEIAHFRKPEARYLALTSQISSVRLAVRLRLIEILYSLAHLLLEKLEVRRLFVSGQITRVSTINVMCVRLTVQTGPIWERHQLITIYVDEDALIVNAL